MRITMVHTADFHGELPDSIPPCDFLTISGDLCNNYSKDLFVEFPKQAAWLQSKFRPWLQKQPVGCTIATWGNHDGLAYSAEYMASLEVPVLWLVDRLLVRSGIRFYGTPWTRRYGGHCYFMVEESRLAEKYAGIQPCDVLISHGPPLGYGDLAPARPDIEQYTDEHVGSIALLERIETVRPQLTVFGHIHPANGLYRHDGLPLANVAVANDQYQPVQRMLKSTWEDGKLVDMEPV